MNIAAKVWAPARWQWVSPYMMPLATRPVLRNMLLTFAILLTAFAIIYSKDISRLLFIEYQAQQSVQNNHYENWTKLLLEQGTLTQQVRIERIAQQRLQMAVPTEQQVVFTQLNNDENN